MPKRKRKKQEASKQTDNKPESLRAYIAEAEQVDLMTRHLGWEILARDILGYKDKLGATLAYMNPASKEFDDARVLYIASDKLLALVEDYKSNKEKAIELLEKIENPETNIVLDVDNG